MQMAHILARQPGLRTRSVPSLQRHLDWLLTNCNLERQLAADVICGNPDLLRCNMTTPKMERKLLFLEEVVGRPQACVARLTGYLTSSLEDRIAPRAYFMRARRRQLSPSLSYLALTPAKFCKLCGCTEAEFVDWRAA